MVRPLDWDSRFFQLEVGEWVCTDAADNAQHFDLIYGKGSHSVCQAPDGFKKSFAETKVVYVKSIEEPCTVVPQIQSIDVGFQPLTDLYDLAFESGKYSRFALDPNLPRERFEALYRLWIHNSLDRSFADDLLGFMTDGTVSGFVTYKTVAKTATIGLIAVDPKLQGRGIGRKLIAAVESNLLRKGITQLRIPTQLENVLACRFYENIGYRVAETQPIAHFWKINA